MTIPAMLAKLLVNASAPFVSERVRRSRSCRTISYRQSVFDTQIKVGHSPLIFSKSMEPSTIYADLSISEGFCEEGVIGHVTLVSLDVPSGPTSAASLGFHLWADDDSFNHLWTCAMRGIGPITFVFEVRGLRGSSADKESVVWNIDELRDCTEIQAANWMRDFSDAN